MKAMFTWVLSAAVGAAIAGCDTSDWSSGDQPHTTRTVTGLRPLPTPGPSLAEWTGFAGGTPASGVRAGTGLASGSGPMAGQGTVAPPPRAESGAMPQGTGGGPRANRQALDMRYANDLSNPVNRAAYYSPSAAGADAASSSTNTQNMQNAPAASQRGAR